MPGALPDIIRAGVFPSDFIDMDADIEQQIKAKALSDAKLGLPEAENPAWDDIDSLIIPAVRARGKKKLQQVRSELESTEQSYQDWAKEINAPSPDEIGIQFAEQALQRAQTQLNEATANYNAFKHDNKINRDATGDDRFVRVILALIVVIVEGMVNSYFFYPAFEHGLISGFFIAFFISFINVGFGFLGGVVGLRYLNNHYSANKKLLGLLAFLACFMVSLLVVAASSYFRGHVDSLRQEAAIDILLIDQLAWQATLLSIQGMDLLQLMSSINSFLLLFIGLLCLFFGIWKGYEYDDPYPGFGHMYRAKEAASQKYGEATRQLKEFEVKKHNWAHKKEQMRSQLDIRINSLQRSIDDNDISTICASLEGYATRLLSLYLEENGKILPHPGPKFPEKHYTGRFEEFKEQVKAIEDKNERLRDQYINTIRNRD